MRISAASHRAPPPKHSANQDLAAPRFNAFYIGLALVWLGLVLAPTLFAIFDLSLLPTVRQIIVWIAGIVTLLGILLCAIIRFRSFFPLVFVGTCAAMFIVYLIAAHEGSTSEPSRIQSSLENAQNNAQPDTAPSAAPTNSPYEQLITRYGEKKVVRINVTPPLGRRPDADLAERAHDLFRPLATSCSITRQPDHIECILAPIDDWPALLGTLAKSGTLTHFDEARKEITFQF